MNALLPALACTLLVACALPARGQGDLRTRTAALLADEGSYYRSPDSGNLAWGESALLEAYVYRYLDDGDTAWLDRLVRHADCIFANLSPNERKRLGWRTPTYSVALARLKPVGRVASDLRPDEERIFDMKRTALVTGHTYRLACQDAGVLQVTDQASGEQLPTVTCSTEQDFPVAPGIELRCDRLPAPGEAWTLATTAPKPIEYVVHDGMVLQPIAHFVELARTRPALARYREAADHYLALMEQELIPKWDYCWRDFSPRTGAYLAQDDPAQRFPAVTLPHNQYLALGRVIVRLYRITGSRHYLDRATRMAHFFRDHLQLVDGHYLWYYWDAAGAWDAPGQRMHQVEDTSHGNIDVGFAIDCYEAGIVFGREDMRRLCRTLLAMQVPAASVPTIGGRVGSAEGDSLALLNWVRLARYQVQVFRLVQEIVEQRLASTRGGAPEVAQFLALQRFTYPRRPAGG